MGKEKDFRLYVSVKNSRLLDLIEEKFGSQAQMSRCCDISQSRISALVTFREKPAQSGHWTKVSVDIATALGVLPEEIWPENMQELKMERSTAHFELDAHEVAQMKNENSFDRVMLRDLIDKSSGALGKRQADFLQWLIDGNMNATYEEKGDFLGVSRERARQIECNMMRKMRKKLHVLGVKTLEIDP